MLSGESGDESIEAARHHDTILRKNLPKLPTTRNKMHPCNIYQYYLTCGPIFNKKYVNLSAKIFKKQTTASLAWERLICVFVGYVIFSTSNPQLFSGPPNLRLVVL